VHAAALGWPIVSDNIYGTQAKFTPPAQRELSTLWRAAPASAFPRDRHPDLQEQGDRAGARAHARAAQDVRVERGV